MSSEQTQAVKNALTLLGRSTREKKTSAELPTAKSRKALDYLKNVSPDEVINAKDLNIRELTTNLFNWSGVNKTNKPLMKALADNLRRPEKYQQTVELTAFAVALAPFFEPDRLTTLYSTLENVNTVFAPATYTLQLSHKLARIFSEYSEERGIKIARSLWEQSHSGRWWELSAEGEATPFPTPDNYSLDELINEYVGDQSLLFHPAYAAQLADAPVEDKRILEALEKYNDAFLDGQAMNPDFALYSSYIPWLPLNKRTESPVESLIVSILHAIEGIDYTFPAKPKKFSDLFPSIAFVLKNSNGFPFGSDIMNTNGKELIPGVVLEVVSNVGTLNENRNYMGNCTWSYKDRMERGSYVLWRIHDGNHIYNASMTYDPRGDTWSFDQINSRFNRRGVPENISKAFRKMVDDGFSTTIPVLKARAEHRGATKQYQLKLDF